MSADGSQLSLTIDELEILKRIVCGQTNREIGEFLALADSIVKARVSRILRKVGAKNRAAAAAWWARYAQFVEAQVEAHADSEVQIPLGKEAQDGSSQL
jgi:DNA-binding CsgD family transcriptional regulator